MRLQMERPLGISTPAWPAIALAAALGTLVLATPNGTAQKPQDKGGAPQAKVGLSINDPGAFQGYTLIAPLMSTKAYLIDMQGRVVQTWTAKCTPGASTYLLENGHLLRTGSLMGEEQSFGGGPGAGGRVQEFNWDGSLVWDFKLFNPKQLPHHDITKLPNGNVLMIVWDKKTPEECLAAGRRTELMPDTHLLPDSILEVKPTGKTTGEIVWEWHLWDHLVQDFDKTKANYGNVAEHPELVNINYGEDALAPAKTSKDQQDKLKSIGYVGANPAAGRSPRRNPDWTHCNSVAYNPELDQIIVSSPHFSEFWIIDHSTTTKEAAGHTGGRSGKGGDLLYRFGNPLAYRAGTKKDQRLFSQHNAHWIPPGLPGAGHVMVFNNGNERPDGNYSSVDELVLPVDAEGKYARDSKGAFETAKLIWSYTAPKKNDFYSFFISGAQRLPNGSTLICSGANGTVFEVTPPDNQIVWKYVNPVEGSMGGPGGPNPFGAPQPGQILAGFLRDMLRLSPEQRKQTDELQKGVDGKLAKLLQEEQKKQLKERPQGGAGGFGSPPIAGEVLPKAQQDRLKLTAEQKKQLGEIQKDVDEKLAAILNDSQKKQLKDMKNGPPFAMFGPGGPGGRMSGGAGGPPQPGQLLPPFLQERLKMTVQQQKELGDFQKELTAKLDKLLNDQQKQQFRRPPSGGPGGMPQPGQIMTPTQQASLKLTADQRKQLRELQKQADDKLGAIFTDDQKKQFKELRANPGRMAQGGGGGPPGGPPRIGNALFRAYRFASNYPGLAGKELTPGKTIEEMEAKEKQRTTKR
jgi:hypothetical protein